MLSLVNYDHAIHDDVRNPNGVQKGILKRGLIGNRLRVEDCDIRRHARPEQATIRETADLSGE